MGTPLVTALLICGVGAVTSAFASSAGILGALIPLAVPLMAQGAIGTAGLVVALAISATVVDSTPFSTVGALVVANTEDDERGVRLPGLLAWGAVMVVTAPFVTWLLFILSATETARSWQQSGEVSTERMSLIGGRTTMFATHEDHSARNRHARAVARRGRAQAISSTSARDLMVMDHGPGAHHRLIESGYRAEQVSHAFFSHLHYDHCMDYGRLVLQRWDIGAGRIPDLEVYGPTPIARMTELLFGEDGVYGPDIRARVEHRSSLDVFAARGGTPPRAAAGAPRDERCTRATSSRATAGRSPWATLRTSSRSSSVSRSASTADGGSVCYSGDSGACDALVELARGCDMLIHMNHHFSGTEPTAGYRAACGNHRDNAVIARRAGVKTLVLTHVLAQIDRPGVRERIVHEIQQEFDGQVIWGEDLMRLTLRRRDRGHRGIEAGDVTRREITRISGDYEHGTRYLLDS